MRLNYYTNRYTPNSVIQLLRIEEAKIAENMQFIDSS